MADYKRLKEVMEFYQMSASAFSKHIGLKGPQSLYDILKGRNRVSKSIADRISAKCLEINIGWLLTGEGAMLKDTELNQGNPKDDHQPRTGKLIPFYDSEVAAGNSYEMPMDSITRPVGMIDVGTILHDSESALRVYGNSMTPNYPPGSVVGLKLHTDSFIVPGKVYIVETRDNRFLKRLYINKDKTAFRCLSDNTMKHESGPATGEYCYPEFEIPFDEVIRMHQVTGVIKRSIL